MSGAIYSAPEPPSQGVYDLMAAHAMRLQIERDEWQACAESLAAFVAPIPAEMADHDACALALAEFERLREGGK